MSLPPSQSLAPNTIDNISAHEYRDGTDDGRDLERRQGKDQQLGHRDLE
jgi:uncharacterized protein YheU (UPF0270 family)